MPRFALTLALLVAVGLHADDDDKPTYTPDGIARVAACYSACILDYADRANGVIVEFTPGASHHIATARCRVWRNVLVAGRACDTGCNETHSALSKPPSKLRTAFRDTLDADEMAYAALERCGHTTLQVSAGMRMFP